MDELLEQFLIEGRELVGDAEGALRRLAADARDGEAIDALFRATHTLKGSVALFAMAPAESLLHAAEALLERARREDIRLGESEVAALLGVIDQVDRWIDAMEREGALPSDASRIAAPLQQALAGEIEHDSSSNTPAVGDAPDWLAALLDGSDQRPPAGGTAFRYAPDPDCFFRGDDPFAIVATVPGLVHLRVVPAEERWPDLGDIDPFRSISVLEGLSTADEAAIRTAFRLVIDQVSIAAIAATTSSAPNDISVSEATAMLRVDGAKLDRLARQSGELSVAVNGLDGLAQRADLHNRALGAELRRAQTAIERAAAALASSIAEVRLVSLAPVLRRLPRLAREVAAALGKDIAFTITGDATEADKQIADALFEPLLHLVRNAIDHGVEFPDERTAAGKAPAGQVLLAIRPDGDRLEVTLRDDGRGIDPAKIRTSAVAKGLITADAASALNDGQAVRLIFTPGFSTATSVSGVSGRGIGMDAVQTAIERLQGSIHIDSQPGVGTLMRISLPLNAITTRLLTVAAGGTTYGLRLDQIIETVRVDAADIQAVGLGEACVIRDRTVPVVDLAELLGQSASHSAVARLVLTEVTGERVALRVDRLGDRIDAMVRDRAGLLANVPAIGGTTVLGDGGVLLILDLPELMA